MSEIKTPPTMRYGKWRIGHTIGALSRHDQTPPSKAPSLTVAKTSICQSCKKIYGFTLQNGEIVQNSNFICSQCAQLWCSEDLEWILKLNEEINLQDCLLIPDDENDDADDAGFY